MTPPSRGAVNDPSKPRQESPCQPFSPSVEAGHAGPSPTLTHGRPTLTLLARLALLWPCERVLVAMGFLGPERAGMLKKLGARLTERGTSGGTPAG
jgi:hypothetical protein